MMDMSMKKRRTVASQEAAHGPLPVLPEGLLDEQTRASHAFLPLRVVLRLTPWKTANSRPCFMVKYLVTALSRHESIEKKLAPVSRELCPSADPTGRRPLLATR
jgi:hypothetical protein